MDDRYSQQERHTLKTTSNRQILKNSDFGGESSDLLGVVFPTHGLTAPWHVIRYALQLPAGKGKHAFVVATRAGTRIASVPLPGLEGTAGYLIALILVLRGYIVRGVMGLDIHLTGCHYTGV